MVNEHPEPMVLVGCTASGKSALALAVAESIEDVELISADSMQVYRGMDIGTAKPSLADQNRVQHHLIDVADAWGDYTVSAYQAAATDALRQIHERGKQALIVGGTGLYVQAVVDSLDIPDQFPDVRAELELDLDTVAHHRRLVELDPLAASRMEPNNRRRVLRALEVCVGSGRPFSTFGPGIDAYQKVPFRQVGIRLPRPVIDARIDKRYEKQLSAGFVGEVETLLNTTDGLSRTARQALGYKELIDHIEGRRSLGGAIELATLRTRRFARRQERWFRRDPRITWLDADDNPMAVLDDLLRDWSRVPN
jgi:tRNA dimethylallyltransferase